mmetsp:Transcript_3716/g.8873  ORF Transcript_3716/g.8873 Transcript_3716/m.8873 type:complete len:275 (-) Transcript_3716:1726-2550(-)|eukprot:CAMPEP_0116091822 /NCGR_PEP_ID=MMETSP0327-20121206/7710_1 /TAXON_ID=44447 /ORGANISM="Pseudo-nitzschia delicatissima, Strain B596" /LENGTH=274 /DNA_ID=CAMNT_0003583199 /DNA_START=88 /DNA_END=912 /DNA_ORIENTATION=+
MENDEASIESIGGNSDCGDSYVPLTDTQRYIVIVAHYCAFLTCTFALWAYVRNFDVIRSRIWSPFLLMTGFVWLQLAAAFEIGNHFYINDWQLFEPISDLINGSFNFLNFGAQDLNALSLRKKGVPLCRKIDKLCSKDGILNVIGMFGDFLFICLIPIRPFIYAFLGRELSVQILSPLGAFAGIFTLFRLWFNLGPNTYTMLGGIFFFIFAMLGVGANAWYNATCIEFVHLGIGGSFITSVIPFGIAILNAELEASPPEDEEEECTPDEETPAE